MVNLVAESARRQAAALDLEPLAVAILRADLHVVRARDDTELVRDAQAALGTGLLPGRLHDDRVDELDHILLFVVLDVRLEHDDGAAQHTDLRRSESNTVGLRQRLAHIVEQHVQPGIKILDLVAVLAQLRVTIFENHSCSHSVSLL